MLEVEVKLSAMVSYARYAFGREELGTIPSNIEACLV